MNLAEWISHYRWQGASHFYLIDNGSTDDWKDKVKDFEDLMTVKRDEKRHIQKSVYNSLLPTLQKNHPNDWVLIVDLDEFLYARPPETIPSYLSMTPHDISQVLVNWKMFGSSG